MIIIEGCDNSGKTTLFNRLRVDLGCLGVINTRPRKEQDVLDAVYHMRELSQLTQFVMDRWSPISESIYGPICRDDHMIDEETLEYLDNMLFQMKATVVYCRPPLEVMQATIFDREQMEGVTDNLTRLYEAYDKRMDNLVSRGIKVLQYNYVEQDYFELLVKLKETK